jgi:Gametolysin peptidase M11
MRRHSASLALVCAATALCTCWSLKSSTRLRGGGDSAHFNASSSVLCRVTTMDTLYVSAANVSSTTEQPTCIPIVDGTETELDFAIDLPMDLHKAHRAEIAMGQLWVRIHGAKLQDEELAVSNQARYTVVHDNDGLRRLSERHLQSNGILTIAVLRISTRDAAPTATATDLGNAIAGPGVNVATQYQACSMGQLQLQMVGNVVEIQLPQAVTDFASAADLVTATQKQFKAMNSGQEVTKLADKVILCLPPGTGDWAASAGVGHWRAQFNNDWCTSLSGLMHELGHTLGLLHAAADGIDYGDRSWYMGSGYTDATWPRKCFNGYNSWKLGWYASRHVTVNPLIEGNRLVKLAAFVDYATTAAAADEYVVLNIANQYYLVYNMAQDFNIDTEQKKNQVTITQPTVNGTNSLAGLSAGSEYAVPNFGGSGRTLVMAACRVGSGVGGSALMVLSIALDQSYCANDNVGNNNSNSNSTAIQSSPSATPPASSASSPPVSVAPPSPSTSAPAVSNVTSIWQLLRHVLTRIRRSIGL